MKPVSTSAWRTGWRSVLGNLRWVQDDQQMSVLLAELLGPFDGPRTLAFVNTHAMNIAATNQRFADDLAQCHWLLRDGSGITLLARRQGLSAGLNLNGTDLIPQVLASYRGRRVALWGTQQPYLDAAARRIEQNFGVQVVSTLDGFLPLDNYRAALLQIAPDLVVLAMGMPKQEGLAALLQRQPAAPGCLVVCGGAILDFLGGKVQRAPLVFRRIGAEWLYRLLLEPRRLFRRYMLGNPLFLWRVFWYGQ